MGTLRFDSLMNSQLQSWSLCSKRASFHNSEKEMLKELSFCKTINLLSKLEAVYSM